MRLSKHIVVLVIAVAGVIGCASRQKGWGPGEFESNRQLSFSVKVGADANDNSPIAMTILVAYDKDIQKAVANMTAQQWFLARKQFLKDHPVSLHEFMYEYVPGQQVRPVVLPIREGTSKGFVFVNYKAVGAWRYEIEPDKPIRMNFGKETLSVSQD